MRSDNFPYSGANDAAARTIERSQWEEAVQRKLAHGKHWRNGSVKI